jgi:hypothetical protein
MKPEKHPGAFNVLCVLIALSFLLVWVFGLKTTPNHIELSSSPEPVTTSSALTTNTYPVSTESWTKIPVDVKAVLVERVGIDGGKLSYFLYDDGSCTTNFVNHKVAETMTLSGLEKNLCIVLAPGQWTNRATVYIISRPR